MVANRQASTNIDLKKCREYLESLQTSEYITRIHSEEINPDKERPNFDESIKQLVLLAEKQARRTGNIHVVVNYVDAIRETPIGKRIFAEDKEKTKQEQKQTPHIEDVNEAIVPPLPEDIALPPEASKGACKWHDAYVKFSKERSPRSFQGFHEANGWALLSTVAKRRIVLYDLGAPKYTPLFTAIVARSSIASKTEAARVFIAVLDRAELKWMLGPDEMTPPAMIDHMKEVDFIDVKDMPEDRTELERKLAFAGQLGWFYEEFGEHIEAICAKNSVMAPFKGIIRRMDDCHDEYRRETISHKEQIVRDPYLSLLACMTPLDLKPYAGIDSPFWTNGFFARFAFIVPDTDEENNARFPLGNLYDAVPEELTKPLQKWHERLGQKQVDFEDVYEKSKKGSDELKGYKVIHWGLPRAVCELSPEAANAFYRYGDALKAIIKKEKLEYFEGNYIRLPMMAMRIAMLCASLEWASLESKEDKARIEMKHWAKGQEFAEQARQGLHSLWIELNKNSFASERNKLEDEICKYIAAQKTYVSVRMLTRGKFQNHTAEELSSIVDNLISSGDLVKHPPVRGGGKYYTVPGKEDRELPVSPKKNSAGGRE